MSRALLDHVVASSLKKLPVIKPGATVNVHQKIKEGEKERTEGDDHAMDSLRYLLMTRPSPFLAERRLKPGSFDWEIEQLVRRRRWNKRGTR